MNEITITVRNSDGKTLCSVCGTGLVNMLYQAEYAEGDRICIETSEPGFYEMRLEDSMPAAMVYLSGMGMEYEVPFGEKRTVYSPKAFNGGIHLISVRAAEPDLVHARRNLAFNPYDQSKPDTGVYPHASANIETRGEAVFAARNVIDGVFANAGHGTYPYQSWGINRRADAELMIDFGVPVMIDELRLTLRSDFPHDSYWTAATAVFSDGSREAIALEKSDQPQIACFTPKEITWLKLCELIKAEDSSPFPALTQLEAWGVVK